MLKAFYVFCTTAGISGYVADTYLNVEHVRGDGSFFDGPVITTLVVAAMAAISLSCAIAAWHHKQRIISGLCILGLGASIIWSFPVSLIRMANSMEVHTYAVSKHNNRVALYKDKLDDITKERIKEGNRKYCGKKCKGLIDKELAVLDKVADIGPEKPKNIGIRNLTYFFPAINEKSIDMALPIAAVVALIVLMNGLTAFGVSGLLASTQVFDVVDVQAKPASIAKRITPPIVNNTKRTVKRKPPRINYTHPLVRRVQEAGEIDIIDLAKESGYSNSFISKFTTNAAEQGLITKTVKDGKVMIISKHT